MAAEGRSALPAARGASPASSPAEPGGSTTGSSRDPAAVSRPVMAGGPRSPSAGEASGTTGAEAMDGREPMLSRADALCRELVARTAAQLEPWSRLLEAARSLGEALVAGDPAAIEAAVVEQERWLGVINRLERRRYRLQEELASAWGLAPSALTWEALARRRPELGAELRRVRDALRARIEGVEAENRRNRALAQQGLAWSRFVLQGVAGASAHTAPAYGRDGQRPWRPPALIDRAY